MLYLPSSELILFLFHLVHVLTFPQMGAMHSQRRREVSLYFYVRSPLLLDPISRPIEPPQCSISGGGKSVPKSSRNSWRWEPQQEPPCQDANARTIVIPRDQNCSRNIRFFPPKRLLFPNKGAKFKKFLGPGLVGAWRGRCRLSQSSTLTVHCEPSANETAFASLNLQPPIIISPGLCLG